MSERRSVQDPIVIEEAARLFRQAHFSHLHGAYAEGQHVTVSVDPRWNTDHESFHALISCITSGHQRVNWARLPLRITPTSGSSSVTALVRLDDRGHAFVPSLPPGEYRLSLRFKALQVTPVLSMQTERLAAQGEEDEERRVWRGDGEDGAVLWTLEETEEGEVQVAFETQAERFAGHVVVFNLIDPISKQVRSHQELPLQPTRTPGKWEAWCALGSRTEFQGPYELVFEIEAAESEEKEP
jgi:hypothetical protein